MAAEDGDIVTLKDQVVLKDTTDKKNDEVKDEMSQWREKPIIVERKEIKDNEKEIEGEKKKKKKNLKKIKKRKKVRVKKQEKREKKQLQMKESKLLKFLGFMWNPLSWVMEAAAVMAIAMANGGVTMHLKK